jgi:hypothetical protein
MKRKKLFVRDIELHGHHKYCPVEDCEDDGEVRPCTCVELDHDDWVAQGEAEMDRRREEPRERVEDDDD